MKPLNVRFSEKTNLSIKDLSSTLNVSDALIARAAMQIGLQHLKNSASKSVDSARSFAAMEDAKSKY